MALSSFFRSLLLAILASLQTLPAPLLVAPALSGILVSEALADDDDDGGDDDDDNGAASSDSSSDSGDGWTNFIPRPQPRKPAPEPVALPTEAADEIVAYGLSAESLARLTDAGFTVIADDERPLLGGIARFRVPPGDGLDEALERVKTLVPEATAAPNSYYYNQSEAPPCEAAICALRSLVDWPLPGNGQCAVAPTIGVVDTGINTRHAVLDEANLEVEQFIEPSDTPSEARHGTAIVAMLVGRPDSRVPGLLPDATVRVADPFAGARGGDRADTYALTRAIAHLIEADVSVINLSLAGPENAVLAGIVAIADTSGIPLVAAVGNAGANAAPLYPAAYQSVLAVTAVDSRLRIYRRAVQGNHVDIAAPGVEIPTAASVSGVRPQTGTSFAAPFVTAALAAAITGGLSAGDARDLLLNNAQDLGEPGHDSTFGHGLLRHSACSEPSN